MKKFLIIAELRSGYQLLASLLNSNPKLLCFGEIFGRRQEVREKSLFQNDILVPQNDESAVDYVEHTLLLHAESLDKHAFGFKLNYTDCIDNDQWSGLWNHIADQKWNIIHLRRENVLDRAISEKLAIKQWRWNHKHYDEQVRITFDELTYYYERANKWRQWANELFVNNPIYHLCYEDLVNQTRKHCTEIQMFLETPPIELHSTLIKQRIGGQSTFLINYRHLYSQCIRHPVYKKFLTDIPVT